MSLSKLLQKGIVFLPHLKKLVKIVAFKAQIEIELTYNVLKTLERILRTRVSAHFIVPGLDPTHVVM